MSPWKKLLSGTAWLLAGNLLSGVLNYGFQLRAASALGAAEYGRLNTWLAYLGLVLSAGAAVQIFSSFHVLGRVRIRPALGVGALLIGMAAALGLFAVGGATGGASVGPSGLSLGGLGASAVLAGLVFHATVGQFQGSLSFAPMSLVLISAAAAKLLWPSLDAALSAGAPARSLAGAAYFVALPLGFGAGAVLGLVLLGLRERAEFSRSAHGSLAPSLVIGFAMALIPQLDILNIGAIASDEVLGVFSRASLFAKAIFFASVTLLQLALPYHLRAARGEKQAEHEGLARLEKLGLAACVLGSFVMAALGPWVSRRFLGFDLEPYRIWILLSCLNLTALYGVLQTVQIECALGRWRRGAGVVALFVGFGAFWRTPIFTTASASLGRESTVSLYLGLALGFYLLVIVWLRMRLNQGERA